MEKPRSKHRPWSQPPSQQTERLSKRLRDPFYHTAQWTRASRIFLTENPLCIHCQQEGFIVASRVTDHIVPKPICRDPWDSDNWQPLCTKHNNLKAIFDKTLIALFNKTGNYELVQQTASRYRAMELPPPA